MSEFGFRRCIPSDFSAIWTIINDAAMAYKGHVPIDCLHDPYMSEAQLRSEIEKGVQFWGCEQEGELAGVMGLQRVRDVHLIRHAYVKSTWQRRGIGARMLGSLRGFTDGPILVGAWADATWAIDFYKAHGYRQVSCAKKVTLLRTYWTISERQIETSVVLVNVSNQGDDAISSS